MKMEMDQQTDFFALEKDLEIQELEVSKTSYKIIINLLTFNWIYLFNRKNTFVMCFRDVCFYSQITQ